MRVMNAILYGCALWGASFFAGAVLLAVVGVPPEASLTYIGLWAILSTVIALVGVHEDWERKQRGGV